MKPCCLNSSGLEKANGLAEDIVGIDSFGIWSLADPMWKTLCLQLLLCCHT
jgi:hypothetical protein